MGQFIRPATTDEFSGSEDESKPQGEGILIYSRVKQWLSLPDPANSRSNDMPELRQTQERR
jgi:hypothetical protein